MIIYLSGKYSGDVKKNIQDARTVAASLWEIGYTVHCPHCNTANFEDLCSASYYDYIRGDLEILARCDAMVLLEGWQESKGAVTERAFAEKIGMPIYEYPLLPLLPTRMSPEQEQHLSITIGKFIQAVVPKYRAGQKEHGGNLWDKPNLPFLLEEVSDFVVYAYTFKTQLEQALELFKDCDYEGARNILTTGNPDGKELKD